MESMHATILCIGAKRIRYKPVNISSYYDTNDFSHLPNYRCQFNCCCWSWILAFDDPSGCGILWAAFPMNTFLGELHAANINKLLLACCAAVGWVRAACNKTPLRCSARAIIGRSIKHCLDSFNKTPNKTISKKKRAIIGIRKAYITTNCTSLEIDDHVTGEFGTWKMMNAASSEAR